MATDDDDDEKSSQLSQSGPDMTTDERFFSVDDRRRVQLQQASQRSRKRQKREAMLCASQISAVRLKIADLERKLEAMVSASPHMATARREADAAFDTKQRIAFLNDKLRAHQEWITTLQNLLASAPLLDFALRLREPTTSDEEDDRQNEADEEKKEEEQGDGTNESTATTTSDDSRFYTKIDEWLGASNASGSTAFSPILIARQVESAVASSQENARKLLNEFESDECEFAVNFQLRGWSHAANLDDKLLTFRSTRVVPTTNTNAIALAVWRSLQLDDILRTFVPLVRDATVVYEADSNSKSVAQRVLQFETASPSKPIVTIESIHESSFDSITAWQIAVETCDDPCLLASAAEKFAAESSPSAASQLLGSPVIHHHASPRLTFAQKPDIVVAVRCYHHTGSSDVLLVIAGSIRHDGTQLVPPGGHVELVQYLANMMPVYEELHLLARAV